MAISGIIQAVENWSKNWTYQPEYRSVSLENEVIWEKIGKDENDGQGLICHQDC